MLEQTQLFKDVVIFGSFRARKLTSLICLVGRIRLVCVSANLKVALIFNTLLNLKTILTCVLTNVLLFSMMLDHFRQLNSFFVFGVDGSNAFQMSQRRKGFHKGSFSVHA